jgi:hypothetical protein
MKEGDIALINRTSLVRIVKIEYKTKNVNKGTFWHPDYVPVKSDEIKNVWWKSVSDFSNIIHTSGDSAQWEWERLITEAEMILSQVRCIENFNKLTSEIKP